MFSQKKLKLCIMSNFSNFRQFFTVITEVEMNRKNRSDLKKKWKTKKFEQVHEFLAEKFAAFEVVFVLK